MGVYALCRGLHDRTGFCEYSYYISFNYAEHEGILLESERVAYACEASRDLHLQHSAISFSESRNICGSYTILALAAQARDPNCKTLNPNLYPPTGCQFEAAGENLTVNCETPQSWDLGFRD